MEAERGLVFSLREKLTTANKQIKEIKLNEEKRIQTLEEKVRQAIQAKDKQILSLKDLLAASKTKVINKTRNNHT